MALISRNLALRLLVAVIFIPILIYICLAGGWPLLILIEVLLAMSLWEFFTLTGLRLQLWHKLLLIIPALFVPYSIQQLESRYLVEAIIATMIFATLPHTFTRELGDVSRTMGLTLLSLFYLTIGFATMLLIPQITSDVGGSGGGWLVYLFATLWIADTAAYFFGWKFGNAKLSPAISPNKTVVGFIGGLGGAILAAGIFNFIFLKQVGFLNLIAPGLIIAFFGQLGDLAESIFKREMGVKDSSNIIPGHGGILDRFDSLVFAAPLLYLYLKWFC